MVRLELCLKELFDFVLLRLLGIFVLSIDSDGLDDISHGLYMNVSQSVQRVFCASMSIMHRAHYSVVWTEWAES